MATKDQRRQKKLERKNAKRKEVRKELASRDQGGLATQFARYAKAPILHSRVAASLWDVGIGYVLLSRELHNGQVAIANFLVDVWCLGVKNIHADIVSVGQYRNKFLPQLNRLGPLLDVSPSYARKLVEGAVEYARDLELPPHREYRIARELFGDIDPNECTEQFAFGREGKPFFVSGPHDSPQRCAQIASILTSVRGQGNFDYLVNMSADEFGSSGITLIDEEDLDDLEVEEVDGYLE
ncbi:MAG: hypothetical protein O3C40_00410 [Planctomycetota bacterium]|nr:hypothetical protein [Planctomycetota bacterium]